MNLRTTAKTQKPNWKRYLLGIFREVLFPTKCVHCRELFSNSAFELDPISAARHAPPSSDLCYLANTWHRVLAPFLCPDCLSQIRGIESPICSTCGIMFKSRVGNDHVCGDCLTTPVYFNRARAFGIYDGPLMAVIHALKYEGQIQLAQPLGLVLFETALQFWPDANFDQIIPVPLHIKRLRQRGFNQSFLLVRKWSEENCQAAAGKILSSIPIDYGNLVRKNWTDSQIGLNRKHRLVNVKNAFELKCADQIADQRLLLIDDVYTTGATVNECAKVLLKAGARQVDVLTLSRAA